MSKYSPYYINVKTRQELFDELNRLRKRVDELDSSGIGGSFNADIQRINREIENILIELDNIEEVDLEPINNIINLIKGDIVVLQNKEDVDLTPINNKLIKIEEDILILQNREDVDLTPINNKLIKIEEDILILQNEEDVDLTPINNKILEIVDGLAVVRENLNRISNENIERDSNILLFDNRIQDNEFSISSIDDTLNFYSNRINSIYDEISNLHQRINDLSGSGGGGFTIYGLPKMHGLLVGDFTKSSSRYNNVDYGNSGYYGTRNIYDDIYSSDKYDSLLQDIWGFGDGILQYEGVVYDETVVNRELEVLSSDSLGIEMMFGVFITFSMQTDYTETPSNYKIIFEFIIENEYLEDQKVISEYILESDMIRETIKIPYPEEAGTLKGLKIIVPDITTIIEWVSVDQEFDTNKEYIGHKSVFGPFFTNFFD